jgi:Calx-beta domain-containing protein
VLTIANDDRGGVIAFGAANVDVGENGGSATVEVVRTGTNLAGGVTVHFATANGSAVAGTHYTATSGTLTFAAGVTTRTFNVPILDNARLGRDKAFQARLSAPGGGGTLGTPTTTAVTILENDTAGAFQFSSPAYAVSEGALSAAITVTRTGTSLAGGVPIGYSTSNGTATAGSDYKAVSGTLTFAAGVTSMSFTVPIINDGRVEDPETINLALNVPPGSPGALGVPTTAVLTIHDNDTPNIRFAVAAQSVTEGKKATVVVTRGGSVSAAATAQYEVVVGGTATGDGVDFELANGTVSFAAGQVSASFSVKTMDDTLLEGPETILIRLSNPSPGTTIGARSETSLTILDNDSAGVMQFSAAAYSVAENVPGGVFKLRVVRTGTKLASGVTVDYAVTGGSATNGVDYTLATGTLTFAAGQTSLAIPVVIQDDVDPEGSETVVVTLSRGSIATTALGPVRVAKLTILDDEQGLSFSAPAYAVTEGTPSIAIPIVRTGPRPGGTTVTCATVEGGTALAGRDYRAVNTTLTFAAGARTVMCVVPILDDTLVDGPVSVNLALSIPAGSDGLLGPLSTAELTIKDNDRAGTMRFGATSYAGGDGGTPR